VKPREAGFPPSLSQGLPLRGNDAKPASGFLVR
jgi:hypothetical protein